MTDPTPVVRISAVINTLNAGSTLASALRSLVGWVDEIVVVDMDSDDDTVEIARSFGATVHRHRRMGYVEPARAFAVEQASGAWIMVLDADEIVPRTLASRLLQEAARDDYDVVTIPWANHLFGAVATRGLLSPLNDRHARFFRRDAIELSPGIHDPLLTRPGSRPLLLPPDPDLCVRHFSHLDAADFLDKLNRYTSIEAAAHEASGLPIGRLGPVTATVREFFRCYIRHQGFRDGWRGYQTALLIGMYRGVSRLKSRELAHVGGRERVAATYAALAEEALAGWDGVPTRVHQ
jgi:glycosyltransferase involved in cell wall biosynthesis